VYVDDCAVVAKADVTSWQKAKHSANVNWQLTNKLIEKKRWDQPLILETGMTPILTWAFDLKIGAPATPALGKVHTNFGFSMPFCF